MVKKKLQSVEELDHNRVSVYGQSQFVRNRIGMKVSVFTVHGMRQSWRSLCLKMRTRNIC